MTGVFDTQQASSLLGYQRTGYGNVVAEICGVSLAKEHSQYDWGQRPIDEDALQYAIDDVRYLPEVAHALEAQVVAADIEEEVAIANQAVMDAKGQGIGYDPAAIYRLKGVGRLHEHKLGILAALHLWRDETPLPKTYRLVASSPTTPYRYRFISTQQLRYVAAN